MLSNFLEYKNLSVRLLKKYYLVLIINTFLILSLFFYIFAGIRNTPDLIPFFYNMPWGPSQLSPKTFLWYLFGGMILTFVFNFIFAVFEEKRSHYFTSRLYLLSSLAVNTLIGSYIYRIIDITSFQSLFIPNTYKLIILPLFLAFTSTIILTPFVIRLAKKYNFMDDPITHKHPGMLLKKPVPRAGGLAYYLGLLIPALIVIPIHTSQKIIGILLGGLICVLIGLRDDRKDVNPYIRFLTQVMVAGIVALSGIILIYIPNPFGETIKLDDFKYVFHFIGEHKVHFVSVLASVIWILVTMNFLSWSNGTDGVYAGLVGISSIVISILMFQSLPIDANLAMFIKLAALSAGASFGLAIFTWPPQKLLWGFGATSAGLMIAALSIVGSTKVATTLIVLMIPFLDGIFAIVRRIRRGQMPFWGDREHLHHKLLEGLGWSKQRVAVFYWASTALLGTIGILTSGETRALSLATLALFAAIGISIPNFIRKPKKI